MAKTGDVVTLLLYIGPWNNINPNYININPLAYNYEGTRSKGFVP